MSSATIVTHDSERPATSADSRIIVIPAYNEEGTVASVVREARKTTKSQVLVVDDCSTDATALRARQAKAIVLSLPLRLGAWGATQAGLRYAQRHDFTFVVTIDADGQHRLADFAKLIGPIEMNRADVAIGICPERVSTARRIAWAFFRAMTGLRIEDLTSGYRVYNQRAVAILTSRSARFVDYQDVGVLLLLRAARLRLIEVKVEMLERTTGGSHIYSSWYAVARYLAQTLVFCVGKWSFNVHKDRYQKQLRKKT